MILISIPHSNTKRNNMLYKHFLPKKTADFFLHSTKTKALILVKEPDKKRRKISSIFKMALFTSQNGPFCSAKPPIFDNLLTFSNDYSHYFGEVTN